MYVKLVHTCILEALLGREIGRISTYLDAEDNNWTKCRSS